MVGIAVSAFITFLVIAPRWTAAQLEARRDAQLQAQIQTARPANLPPCPSPGPERDHFLEVSASALAGSLSLWAPVCRVVPLPAHHIVLVTKTRTELGHCEEASIWRPASVICAMEEPLGFLANARAARTSARREIGEMIWMTSQPMAWQDHLVVEHRERFLLGIFGSVALVLLFFGILRLRYASLTRESCHAADEPELPRNTELLLHWVLGRGCRSLPGDLSEEYVLKLESGLSLKEAHQWYRWQVMHSVAPVVARGIELAFRLGSRRNPFARRG